MMLAKDPFWSPQRKVSINNSPQHTQGCCWLPDTNTLVRNTDSGVQVSASLTRMGQTRILGNPDSWLDVRGTDSALQIQFYVLVYSFLLLGLLLFPPRFHCIICAPLRLFKRRLNSPFSFFLTNRGHHQQYFFL